MNAPVITTTKLFSTKEMEGIAERIRNSVRRAAEDIISIGQDLTQVKDQLGHGKFLTWIDREFGMTERSARRYMAVGIWAKGKSDTVADLPPSTLYLLAAPSTPIEVVDEVVADIDAGKAVDSKEVKARVEAAKAAATPPAHAALDKEEESQSEPEPACHRRRRTREEIDRDLFFEKQLSRLEVVARLSAEGPVPKLNAEEAEQAIKQINKVGASLRRLRHKIKKQHPCNVVEVDQAVDDDPLAIPAIFRRETTT